MTTSGAYKLSSSADSYAVRRLYDDSTYGYLYGCMEYYTSSSLGKVILFETSRSNVKTGFKSMGLVLASNNFYCLGVYGSN